MDESKTFIRNLAQFRSCDSRDVDQWAEYCNKETPLDAEELLTVMMTLLDTRKTSEDRLPLLLLMNKILRLDRSIAMSDAFDKLLPDVVQALDKSFKTAATLNTIDHLCSLTVDLKRFTRFRNKFYDDLARTHKHLMQHQQQQTRKRRRSPSPSSTTARIVAPRIDLMSIARSQPRSMLTGGSSSSAPSPPMSTEMVHTAIPVDASSLQDISSLLSTIMADNRSAWSLEQLFSKDSLNIPPIHDVELLYTGRQCKTCGERQPTDKCMAQHLDQHFRDASQDMALIRSRKSKSAGWMLPASEWSSWDSSKPSRGSEKTEEEKKLDKDKDDEQQLVDFCKLGRFRDLNAPFEETCAICNEVFGRIEEVDDDVGTFARGIMQPAATFTKQQAELSVDKWQALVADPIWIDLQDRLTRLPKDAHERFVHATCFVVQTGAAGR